MKKIPFGTIFQVIQIIALGYLLFKILQPSSATEVLNRIEQNQIELKKQQEEIISANAAGFAKYDSANKVRVQKIDSAFTRIGTDLSQVRKMNKSINDLAKAFRDNQVDLPDPDK